MLEIDGSYLEGGGQILRTALALSSITKTPCRIFNIRKGRQNPGLQNQHLSALRSLAELCNAKLEGDILGSQEIKFWPGEIVKDKISIKIETAAAITLIFQSLIPACLFVQKPVEIKIDGGATDTFFAPTVDYFRFVFLKILEKMGAIINIEILKRGYYPQGGASIKAKILPAKLKPIRLTERGNFKKILAFSGASEYLRNKKVAERQLSGVREILGKLNLPIEERSEYYYTQCPGSQVCLIAQFENTVIGVDNLGRLGKSAEDVGKETAFALLKEEKANACLDKHLADQILPYMALIKDKSWVTVSEISNHFKTNIWVIEKFLAGRFELNGNLVSWTPK